MKNYQQSNEEKLLLKKSSMGDESAFWKLWELNQESVQRKCRHFFKQDVIAAEEVYSNVLFKIHRILPDHAARISNFSLWILRITENLCIDVSRKSQKNIRLEDIGDSLHISSPELFDSQDHEYDLDPEILMDHFYSQLKRIPSKHRNVLILRCIYNKSYDEIALFFMITNETCRKRYEIARKYLSRSLLYFSDYDINQILNDSSKIRESSIWEKIKHEIDSLIANRKTEIDIITSHSKIIVQKQISGYEKFFLIFCHTSFQKKRTRIATLKKYISSHPSGWKKRLELGKLFFVRGNWNSAYIELSTVLKIYPGSIETRIIMAELYIKNGMKIKAAKVFEEGISFLLNLSSKHFFLGMIDYCKERYDNAIINFSLASVLEPDNAYYPFLEGKVHLIKNRFNAARLAFEQAIRINPSDIKPYPFYLDILRISGLIEQSVRSAFDISHRFPDDLISMKHMIIARCKKGLVFGQEGNTTRNLIKKLKQHSSHLPMTLEVKAAYYFYRGEWTNAYNLIEKAPVSSGNSYVKIKWMLALGEVHKAREYLSNFMARYKLPIPNISFLACNVLIAENNRHLVIKLLDGIFFHNKSSIEIQLRILRQLSDSQIAPQLIKKYSLFMMKHHEIPEIYYLYSKSLVASNKIRLAQRFILKGWHLQSTENFTSASFTGAEQMAVCHKLLNNEHLKFEWFKIALMSAYRIVQIDPAFGWFCVGSLYRNFGKKSRAKTAFTKSLEFNLPYPYRKVVLEYSGKKKH